MKRVVAGIIGSGFAAELHVCAYQKVCGLEVVIKAVSSLDPKAGEFAERHGILHVYEDYHRMLQDPEIEVVDIIAPPCLHADMVIDVVRSGKHVICEKPLTGFFGTETEELAGNIPKAQMYEAVYERLVRLKSEVEQSVCRFMYAENYIYTPALMKSLEFLQAQNDRILFIRAEESHNGSHAVHAAYWKMSGGGSLIRQGCHPLSAVLLLKDQEGKRRGETIRVTGVMADMGNVTRMLTMAERSFIDAHPVDVEDLANVTVTFSDGSKAVVMAGDMVVGGVKNLVEIYTDKSVYHCNMAATDGLYTYHSNEENLDHVYVTEKLGTKSGWQKVFLEEEIMRGYVGELQDFMECVVHDREPLSGYSLASRTIELVYAAYRSADEGRRIELDL